MIKTLFITPPFTQLNTPYPATAYLKGFFNTFAWPSEQMDLGIEVILQVFSKEGLKKIFAAAESYEVEISENAYRIYQIRAAYLRTIDPAIQFLQNRNPTLAHIICDRNYLPEASRFAQIEDLDWAFGSMGIQDRARHLVTLYLEDLGDFIKEVIDPHFGFSRYAERLSSSATHFDPILDELEQEDSLIMEWMKAILARKVAAYQPDLLCLSVPFPGNLFAALKCGQWVKQQHPTTIKVVLGGGYANTELRSLGEERLFDFIDFVSLDDGEAPLQCLMEYLNGQRAQKDLKRIFYRQSGVVQYSNGAVEKDVPQRETGTPDYSGLLLKDYLSVIELANPMHRLWSDGRWNKLTLAHGCYWGKCSFCDVSLDYIKRYEPLTASLLCDRIESIIEQTGENGFHFVDEAAPPALMRDLALEIIRRQLTVVWWTNIRFEKNFTADLCRLLKASGCTAVSGGLEVASDRLLESMKKGVTVAQVARVANHFTEAGIMVHAYLMYGFPTQTDQETIDSLEMVRQLFEYGALQSGFWHQFAMTAHSPVGLDPQAYGVAMLGPEQGTFANNDLIHEDVEGADHLRYAEGLKKSLFNYMHGLCFEDDLGKWFDFGVPTTSIPSDYIEEAIEAIEAVVPQQFRKRAMVIWLDHLPELESFAIDTDGGVITMARLHFYGQFQNWTLELDPSIADWLMQCLPQLQIGDHAPILWGDFIQGFIQKGLGRTPSDLIQSYYWKMLTRNGLLIL